MKDRIVVIGASLSGIDALCELLSRLPANFPAPIFITQHVASHSPGMLPTLLNNAGPLLAAHARHAEHIEAGRVYVAPPDRHMLVRKGAVALSHGPRENFARPAIDPLFRSAALAYGPAVVAVVLTGQLDDGTAGMLAVKDLGGTCIVQDPSEATAASMPRSAIRHVKVDHCCKLAVMAPLLVQLANDDPPNQELTHVDTLLRIEDHVAEGLFTVEDWWQLEQCSAPSGLNCPACRSALYELNDRRVLRFRCRSGHAFSALSLLSAQADARELYLSSTFGALMEEATLIKRMRGGRAVAAEAGDKADGLAIRLDVLEREAAQICEWLRSTSDLVEPEPLALPDTTHPAS